MFTPYEATAYREKTGALSFGRVTQRYAQKKGVDYLYSNNFPRISKPLVFRKNSRYEN